MHIFLYDNLRVYSVSQNKINEGETGRLEKYRYKMEWSEVARKH